MQKVKKYEIGAFDKINRIILKYLCANPFGQVALSNLCSWGSQWHEQLHKVVQNLHPTEDGEAGEEPHGAADEAELGLQGHLHIPLYLVIGGRVKVDLDQLQGGGL